LSADQIKKRVQEIARQISRDYQGRTLHVVAVMENGFIFMADLVRELDIPVVCQFVKGEFNDEHPSTTEIFYSPEVEVAGKDVLLVEALIQSGCHSSLITLVFC
jgi:hypoxanthine phosphoribosyltransferase